MVLPGMALSYHPDHPRFIGPHDHKQIFTAILMRGQFIDYLDIGKPLPVGTDFILALHKGKNTAVRFPIRGT
jgi:hypothetical protein